MNAVEWRQLPKIVQLVLTSFPEHQIGSAGSDSSWCWKAKKDKKKWPGPLSLSLTIKPLSAIHPASCLPWWWRWVVIHRGWLTIDCTATHPRVGRATMSNFHSAQFLMEQKKTTSTCIGFTSIDTQVPWVRARVSNCWTSLKGGARLKTIQLEAQNFAPWSTIYEYLILWYYFGYIEPSQMIQL